MQSGEISFLNQLISSIEETLKKLEEAKKKNDYLLFDKSKKNILRLQKQVREVLND